VAKPYSMDLHERAVACVAAGESVRAVAVRFAVSASSVVKWSQRVRRTGSVAPGKMGGHRPKVLVGERRAWLLGRMAERAFTLRGLAAELAERGIKVDYRTVWAFVHGEGLSFKKSVLPSEQDRPAIARRRAQWRARQTGVDPRRLGFLDETWAKTNMAPRRGWSSRGHRLRGSAPHGHWRTMTLLAALRHDRIDAPWVVDGPIDGAVFRTYVEAVLVPTLRPGDIVILDNLGSHKGQAVRRAIRAAGAKLLFLPSYSPDLNPIEQVFAKLEHLLRKAAERTTTALWQRIGQLLASFTPDECRRYLANAGYASA
jgi:transposase